MKRLTNKQARELYKDREGVSGEIERRQTRLQANAEAIERWQRKLFRAAGELKKLTEQRKRLLAPRAGKLKLRDLDAIPRLAGGGDDFNDDIPL